MSAPQDDPPQRGWWARFRAWLLSDQVNVPIARTANWFGVITAVLTALGLLQRWFSEVNWSGAFAFDRLQVDLLIRAYRFLLHTPFKWLGDLIGWHPTVLQKDLLVLYFLVGGAVAHTFFMATRGPYSGHDAKWGLYTFFEAAGSSPRRRYTFLAFAPLLWPLYFPFFLITPLLYKAADDDPDRAGGYFTQPTNTYIAENEKLILDFRWYFAKRLLLVIGLTLAVCLLAAIANVVPESGS
jgi:hypothetical protein